MKSLILVCVLCVSVYSAKLPSYLKKCKLESNNAQCVIENGHAAIKELSRNGEPKFKLPVLSPVRVKHIKLQATPELSVSLDEVDFTGFQDMQLVKGTMDKNGINFYAKLKKMAINGNYDLSGKILVLPIKGNGVVNITGVEFDVDYTAKFTTEERKGKKYFNIKDEDSTLKILDIEHIYLHFDNLFDGDERLGTEMNKFLNENWVEAFAEVKPAIEQAAAYSIVNYFIRTYLHFIPIDELFDKS